MGDVVGREEFTALCNRVDNHIKHIDDICADTNTRLSRIEGGLSTMKWVVGIGLTVIGLGLTTIGVLTAIK